MRILGLEITRASKALEPPFGTTPPDVGFSPVDGRGGGWFPIIREPYTGAWQQNVIQAPGALVASVWVFRCISLISSDIAKLCLDLLGETSDDIWQETTSAAFSPVLAKPNPYQNRIQFVENWMNSKLIRGNAYVLKERDQRGVVTDLHVLHPDRVRPLVSPDGSVFYQLGRDLLAGVGDPNPDLPAVPASEMIHDRWNCLFHPLVGLSPIFACGLQALQGLGMQGQMSEFYKNGARPGGILTAPGHIADDTATRLKDYWETNFSGQNAGRVAVLGDGLTFEPLMMKAADSQFIEQLKWNAESICAAFGVPSYMVNLGEVPARISVEALAQMYYSQCLQIHIESIELCLDEGLKLPAQYMVKFDLDGLLRMDQATLVTALVDGIGGGLYAPNEARKKVDLPPVKGGDAPYMQEQNYSLEALARRDSAAPAPPTSGATPANDITPPADAAPAAPSQNAMSASDVRHARLAVQREPAWTG